MEALRAIWRYTHALVEYFSPLRLTITLGSFFLALLAAVYLFTHDIYEVLSWGADSVPLWLTVLGIILSVKKPMKEEQQGALLVFLIMLGFAGTAALHLSRSHDQHHLDNRIDTALGIINGIQSKLSVQGNSSKPQTGWERQKDILDSLRGEYILTHKDISSGLLAGTEWPPNDWMKRRLQELGEQELAEHWNFSFKQPLAPARAPSATSVPGASLVSPSLINLCNRANALADEMMQYLYFRGWPTQVYKSGGADAFAQWDRDLTQYFRYKYLDQVKQIGKEFASFHYVDSRLDEELKSIDQLGSLGAPILPQEIADMADRLRLLAKQASPENYREPRPLSFKEKVVPATWLPKIAPYQLEIEITTKEIITQGYIVVEFSAPPGAMVSDLKGAKYVSEWGKDVTNDKLSALFKAYSADYTKAPPIYAFEIGDVPFVPSLPIHVTIANKTEVHVKSVTLY